MASQLPGELQHARAAAHDWTAPYQDQEHAQSAPDNAPKVMRAEVGESVKTRVLQVSCSGGAPGVVGSRDSVSCVSQVLTVIQTKHGSHLLIRILWEF